MTNTAPSLTDTVWNELKTISMRGHPVTLTARSEPLPDGTFVGSLTGVSRRPEPLTGVLIPTVDDRLLMRETHSGHYAFPLSREHITAAHMGLNANRRAQYTLDLDEGMGGSKARLTLTLG